MIYAGIIAGVAFRFWLWPKWGAARIIRQVEAANRAAHNNRKGPTK